MTRKTKSQESTNTQSWFSLILSDIAIVFAGNILSDSNERTAFILSQGFDVLKQQLDLDRMLLNKFERKYNWAELTCASSGIFCNAC